MRITCPNCGLRDHSEFSYEGDASRKRPESQDANEWNEYVYLRDNPKGRHKEYWAHTHGCRSWIIVERNTMTHEVYNSYLPNAKQDD